MREGVRVREGDKFWVMDGLLRGGAVCDVMMVDCLLAIDRGKALLITGCGFFGVICGEICGEIRVYQ